jgi:two-component system chemotaxis response regulator CheY
LGRSADIFINNHNKVGLFMPGVPKAEGSKRPSPPLSLFAPLSVLVVDDMPTIRRMLRQMLRFLGVGGDIREAADGLEAWELLCQQPADLVVCDINMPRMNGLELLRLLRSTPRFETTPFLMVTGEVSEDIVAASAENEVDAYILKPFKVESLAQRLRTIIQHRHHPSPGEAAFLRAKKLLAARRPQEALLLLEQLVSPPHRLQAKVLNLMGECYLALGENAEAASCFNQTLEINPCHLKAYQNLARLFEIQGDAAAARHCLEEARKLSPFASRGLLQGEELALPRSGALRPPPAGRMS